MGNLIAIILSITLAQAGETRMRVAILDTGLSRELMAAPWVCKDGHVDLTGTNIYDSHGHGSNVAAIIGAAIDPAIQCAVIIKWTTGGTVKGIIPFLWAYKTLFASDVRWINYSAQGAGSFDAERDFLIHLLRQGKHVSVAAGNQGQNLSRLCNVFPACYGVGVTSYWHVVANGKSFDNLSPGSNYSGPVNEVEDGHNVFAGGYMLSGTSQATALHTARLIREYNAGN